MIRPIVLILAIAYILISCSKETEMHAYYYLSNTGSPALSLFIDGANKGELPVIEERPDMNSSRQTTEALNLVMSPGSHLVEVKKADGTVVGSHTLNFSDNFTTGNDGFGGCEVQWGSCNDMFMVALSSESEPK